MLIDICATSCSTVVSAVAATGSGLSARALVEGTTVACGKVSVPENHDKPDGRQIDLTFMLLKSHSQSPAADPVVYLHGGPGSGCQPSCGSVSA